MGQERTKANLFLRALVACLCASFLSVRANAVDPARRISQYVHSAWRMQDGVVPGVPEAITQTEDGYIWIGTYAGLVRFDGVRFVSWAAPEGKHLPDSRIFSLLGSKDGSLWIGTLRGLAKWKNGELVSYLDPRGRFNSIVEDDKGTIWGARSQLYDTHGPLCQVMGNALRCYGATEGVPIPSANRMAKDNLGNLWIGGSAGLCRWKFLESHCYFQDQLKRAAALVGVISVATENEGSVWAIVEGHGAGLELQHLTGGVWQRYVLPGITEADPGVTALMIDRDHGVWVGTASRGIYRIHDGDVDHFDRGDGLSSNAVAGFYQDREGTLWVATSNGIDNFRDVRVASYSMREGLTADSASTVLASRNGGVWIGNSGAVDILKDGKLSSIRTHHGLPGRDVTTMFEDHEGRLWVGVDQVLAVYDGGRFDIVAKGIAFSITEDSEHNIWARVGPKLLRIKDMRVRDEIALPQIPKAFTIAADPQGGIWLGINDGDLLRYWNGQMEGFPTKPPPKARQVRALWPESDGSVWGATEEGLVRWKDGQRKILTSLNGLPCDEIYTLVRDDAGSMWLYAKCGIISIAEPELEKWWRQPDATVAANVFSVFDGAQAGITPLQPQASKSRDGRLWFANDSILQMIDPNHLGGNKESPPVQIEQIIADHKDYPPRERVSLPALTRDLEIDYTGLSFVAPQKVRFRYKLEGHDPGWEEAGTRREAFYTDLPPGNYKFRVMACNNDGVWNESGATLNFNVAPAFYQADWFRLLCACTIALLAWAAYQWRVRLVTRRLDLQFGERLAERTRIAQELHDTLLQGVLSASMQLNVASDQVADNSPAKPVLRRVLELLRDVIEDGRRAVTGLRLSKEGAEDLEQAFSRIPQELAIQREIDFRVIVEGSARALHPMIRDEVYRIGREALVNALRHSGARAIEVELEYGVHQLRVMVRDNGCGIDPQVLDTGRAGHWGLSGMRERAEAIGGKLRVWSRTADGTEVELRVPGRAAFESHPTTFASKWMAKLQARKEAEASERRRRAG